MYSPFATEKTYFTDTARSALENNLDQIPALEAQRGGRDATSMKERRPFPRRGGGGLFEQQEFWQLDGSRITCDPISCLGGGIMIWGLIGSCHRVQPKIHLQIEMRLENSIGQIHFDGMKQICGSMVANAAPLRNQNKIAKTEPQYLHHGRGIDQSNF